jgi:hypothetical protein
VDIGGDNGDALTSVRERTLASYNSSMGFNLLIKCELDRYLEQSIVTFCVLNLYF